MDEKMKARNSPTNHPPTCPALYEAVLPMSFPGDSERRGSRLGAYSLNGPAARAGSTSG